jgi:hypothetical protein
MGYMEKPRCVTALAVWFLMVLILPAQVIEFESGGLKYQTLTKNAVTVMVASLPSHVREYSILQVAISNGSPISWMVRPEDFTFYRNDGTVIQATPARVVVNSMVAKASRGDVIKLVTTYESSLYGLQKFKSTNGYEARRQAAFAEVSSTKIKAAAAASAIAFVPVKLAPGQSTDGAVFWSTQGKPLGQGQLRVNAAGEVFEFTPQSAPHP